MTAPARKICNLIETASILGISRTTLAGWLLREGAPAVKRANRAKGIEWRIHPGDVIRWLIYTEGCAALRARAPINEPPAIAKCRRALESAIMIEIMSRDGEIGPPPGVLAGAART